MSADYKEKMECRVLETANRLRLIQVDFADESAQTRADYLREEIGKALKTVLPAERHEFLRRLLERFPTGSLITKSMSEDQKIESAPKDDESELRNVDFLVRRLLEIAPTLSDNQKESIDKSLQQAGLRPQTRQDYSVELDQEQKEKPRTGGEHASDAAQLAELNAMLVDFVSKIEPVVWNTWRKLSPRSTVRPHGPVKTEIGRFLGHDTGISGDQVDRDLKTLQRLIAAIISAVSQVGGQFAKRHLARFSPPEIEALVRMEHGSVFVSHEVKCWRKYVELAETLNEDSIEMEIRKAIVDYVESLAKGMGQ